MRECRHAAMEDLGLEEGAHFYKCETCKEVLVVQGGHLWRMRPDVVPA